MNVRIMADSPIRFPGLFGDWAFTGSSVAFHIGGKAIYWYGIIIALGVLLALWFCMKQKEKYGITEDNLMDGVLWGIPLAIVGARLYYVLFYLDRFKKADGSFDWAESIAIWDGGLAIYGGVIAAVLVCFVLSKKRGFKLGALTDLIVMGFLIGQAVGRWGNFMNREAFGAETTLPWRMQLTTTAGTLVEVHPTFLYESLWNVVGLLLIVFIVAKGRRFDGENTWFYFLWYGIGRFWARQPVPVQLDHRRRAHPRQPGAEPGDGAGVGVYAAVQHQAASPQAGGVVCEYRRGAEGGRGRKRGRQRGLTRCGFGAVYRPIAEHHMQPAFGTGGAVKKNTHG